MFLPTSSINAGYLPKGIRVSGQRREDNGTCEARAHHDELAQGCGEISTIARVSSLSEGTSIAGALSARAWELGKTSTETPIQYRIVCEAGFLRGMASAQSADYEVVLQSHQCHVSEYPCK